MTAARPWTAATIQARYGALLVAATLAVALLGTSAAFAADRPALDCMIRFQLSGWSAIYERVDGTGIVACADDTSLPVLIQARGAGLTVGKSKVTSGTGKFADVHQISDVLGRYAQGDFQAGVATSGAAQLLTNGKVSLGLQAGLQSQSLVLMFMSQEALDRFTRGNSWTAGADASVAIGRVGANGRLETLDASGVIAFALTNAGLMAGARVDGTRISKVGS